MSANGTCAYVGTRRQPASYAGLDVSDARRAAVYERRPDWPNPARPTDAS
jgi:hypothetical protein